MNRFWLLVTVVMLASIGRADSGSPSREEPVQTLRKRGVGSPLFTNHATAAIAATTNAPSLPPLPPGVADLKFGEIFKPVGSRGLEYTEKCKSLDGKKVRILGYMVRQSQPLPATLLLSPIPLQLHEDEYGFAEDLPATIVHVFLSQDTSENVLYTPGMLLLTGTLTIGTREEPDGRISSVRLALDPATSKQSKAAVDLREKEAKVSTTAPAMKHSP